MPAWLSKKHIRNYNRPTSQTRDIVRRVSIDKLRSIADDLVSSVRLATYNFRYNRVPLRVNDIEVPASEYLSSMIVQSVENTDDDVSFSVSIPDSIHTATGLKLSLLARIHEYGTSEIAPRPTFRPVMSQFVVTLPGVTETISNEIIRSL